MSLSKQVYAYSVDTSCFYDDEEMVVHNRLNKLYVARARVHSKSLKCYQDTKWRKKHYNRLIKKRKEELSGLLDDKKETGLVRILRPSSINDRNVISLFESSTTRALGIKTGDTTTDLFVVSVFFYQVFKNLVLNGFEYNGERYVFLTASAGQIRTKRGLFIKESAYDKIKMRMMCGLTWEHINERGGINPNKYCAYLSLNNSATDVWEDFDIDKAIVVDDFETAVPGLVDYIDSVEYKITRKQTDTVIPHSDGWGMADGYKTRMIRMPWVKGLLTNFPFNDWVKENCPGGKCVVTDIYGKEYQLPSENIKFILTKSQFKLAKYYDDWDDYKRKFKKYGCEACYCNLEDDNIPKARINYQMLQTLSDMTDSEVGRVTKRTVEEINRIGHDLQTDLRLLGATENNSNRNSFQEAIRLYPELMRDSYSQDVLKQTKKSFVKQARAGRLRVNGKYLFISPDPIAFCQWLFLGEQNPSGVLADGEVYCREFNDGDELACLRSPHLYREWAIRNNRRSVELDKWLSQTNCVYTSCHDLISRFLMFDVDGDKALVIKDKTLTNVAKRNMADIVPLAYDLKKAKGGTLSLGSIHDGMISSYSGGNIGPISNNISKIWGNSVKVSDNELSAVKYLCFYNNAVIDYAKTLWLPEFPGEISELIKSYTRHNLPNYFKYAKEKDDEQVEKPNESTMNRISATIPNTRIKFSKTLGNFDYTVLMNRQVGYDVGDESVIIQRYTYWVRHRYLLIGKDYDGQSDEDMRIFQKIRDNLISESGKSAEYIANTLVRLLYIDKPTWTKKILWGAFGREVLDTVMVNIVPLGRYCAVCGRRFKPKYNVAQMTCSEECSRQLNVIKQRERDVS